MLNIYQANFSLCFENIGRDLEIMLIQSKLTARTLARFLKKMLEASLRKEQGTFKSVLLFTNDVNIQFVLLFVTTLH